MDLTLQLSDTKIGKSISTPELPGERTILPQANRRSILHSPARSYQDDAPGQTASDWLDSR
jgi:hypothetical protein